MTAIFHSSDAGLCSRHLRFQRSPIHGIVAGPSAYPANSGTKNCHLLEKKHKKLSRYPKLSTETSRKKRHFYSCARFCTSWSNDVDEDSPSLSEEEKSANYSFELTLPSIDTVVADLNSRYHLAFIRWIFGGTNLRLSASRKASNSTAFHSHQTITTRWRLTRGFPSRYNL